MKTIFFIILTLFAIVASAQPDLFERLHHTLDTVTVDSVKQNIFLDLAWEYSLSNLDTAEYYAHEGVRLAKARGNGRDLATAREMLAIIYDQRGMIGESVQLYLKAAEFYENSQYLAELSSTYNNLGTLFFYNEELDKAEGYFMLSLKIDEEVGDSLGVASSMVNMASIANRKEDYVTAYNYLMRGKKIVASRPDSWTERALSEALANHHLYRKNYDSSAYYYRLTVPLAVENHDTNAAIVSQLGLVKSYLYAGDLTEANQLFKVALSMAAGFEEIYTQKEVSFVGKELYANLGEYQQAYFYQQQFQAFTDSIFQLEKVESIHELEKKYQAEQRERQIAQLEIENQKSLNQRNIWILAWGLIVLAALFLVLLLRSKSKSNQVISKSLFEKEVLLKEIHHRVKNNLQVISSLLSLQSRFIQDEKAQEAVNEGQNRVKSMALIHQKLYQKDNLMGVEALDYIKNLTASLKSTYGIDDRINIEYQIDPLNIDIDTIIPIGLILNELISNAFKHAFPVDREGCVMISLKEEQDLLNLVVSDDGIGVKPSQKSNSFGMNMINSLARKLEAEVNFKFDQGTIASLLISNYKLV